MNLLQEIRDRFEPVLASHVEETGPLLNMIRPAQDPKFGDYQANCAMPLGKRLGKPPRDVAQMILDATDLDSLAQETDVAGPGFINIRLDESFIRQKLLEAFNDLDRLGIPSTADPKTIVIDFSSPNVAKPMHVGHIRSTVIGDSLARILGFLGHHVITDNHLGDWGTQFGMIIYGYKHFLDDDAWQSDPVVELSRLYRTVRALTDYHAAAASLPEAEALLAKQQTLLEEFSATDAGDDRAAAKKLKKDIKSLRSKIESQTTRIDGLRRSIQSVDSDPDLALLPEAHANIGDAVLRETVLLHEGDPGNRELWNQFMVHGRAEIQRVYQRLNIQFDHELGESFYHASLGQIVDELVQSGAAIESEGAICVFLENHDAPMIVRKRDGAFLYATTDMATIRHRMTNWKPDTILYVVDFRQSEHFEKLFDVARAWGYPDVEYRHISFGTVMGDDGRPFKTRSGDTVGLESLLDEAESRALQVVSELDDQKPEPEFSEQQRREIARVVGISALKYADLSQNRSSDYTFSYDKMVSLRGNTATYLQYGFARVNGIFRRGEIDVRQLRGNPVPFEFVEDVERQLGVKLLRFEEALADVVQDYRPNLLANYLFELTQLFFVFFDKCPVLKADGSLRQSRLQLCDLTARTIRQGLELLGMEVVDRM